MCIHPFITVHQITLELLIKVVQRQKTVTRLYLHAHDVKTTAINKPTFPREYHKILATLHVAFVETPRITGAEGKPGYE